MALPTSEELRTLSSDTGYPAETLETVTRLLDLLQAIANDPILGPNVALKGGTAINGFHSNWPRLSLDIDLVHMAPAPLSALDEIRPRGNDALRRLLLDRGYGIEKDPTGKTAGGKWETTFASHFSEYPRLDVDLGYVDRQPLLDPVIRSSAPVGGRMASVIRVLDEREVIGGKLSALFTRRAARDLFDAIEILNRAEKLDWRHIKATFLVRSVPRRIDPRSFTIDRIGTDRNDVQENLAHRLRDNLFDDEAQVDKWIAESVETCRARLRSLIRWTPNEIAFIEGIRDTGEINPHLLDADPEFRDRVPGQPALHRHIDQVRQGRSPQTFSILPRRPGRSLSF